MPLLPQYCRTIFVPEFLDDLLRYFEPMADVLSRLDNKDKSNTQPPSRQDVVSLLRTIDGESELEECITDRLNAAGPLFMLCVHLLVPMTLMWNPVEYADKARRNVANQTFKEDPRRSACGSLS